MIVELLSLVKSINKRILQYIGKTMSQLMRITV